MEGATECGESLSRLHNVAETEVGDLNVQVLIQEEVFRLWKRFVRAIS
jgi:hypothetical protein